MYLASSMDIGLVFTFDLHAARTVSSLGSKALFSVRAKSLKDVQVLVNVHHCGCMGVLYSYLRTCTHRGLETD